MKTFITHYSVVTPEGELQKYEGRIKAFGWLTAKLFLWLKNRSRTESIYGLLVEEQTCDNGTMKLIRKKLNQNQ